MAQIFFSYTLEAIVFCKFT